METPELFTPENAASGDQFIVEDLLNFSNDDAIVTDGGFVESVTGDSTESSTVTVVDSCNSSSVSVSEPNFGGDCGRNVGDGQFAAGDLSVPYDDLAELDQWLSNFVEESFSNEDLQKLQLISGMKARPNQSPGTRKSEPDDNNHNQSNDIINDTTFDPDMPVPGKARSKRSRVAPCNWASRFSVLSPSPIILLSEPDVVVPTPQLTPKKPAKITGTKTRDGNARNAPNGEGRKCLHCATDRTPQWRTGPMGPKTLCNACGVRYKSGRLVPEYRPAASPTSVLTKHSNSHRKVMELRRQKEMMKAQQQQFVQHLHQNMIFDVSNGDDYLIHQHLGSDFRQLT